MGFSDDDDDDDDEGTGETAGKVLCVAVSWKLRHKNKYSKLFKKRK